MCGIFGAVKREGFFDKENFSAFVRLTDIVKYRGPDDAGYVVFNTVSPTTSSEKRFNIFLGHRRLSIIDLSAAGHQPFTDGAGLWIVFNGEIFNYLELREDLKKKGHTFTSNTDTEVILKVYKEFGESGFAQFNGMWAFAIVDLHRKRIVLSRDRFSIKPLYVLERKDELFFASEIKQLLPLCTLKRANSNILYAFLQQGIMDFNAETFFEEIFKVEPKTNVIISLCSERSEKRQYWDYELQEIPDFPTALETFRELLIDSIRIRLRSDVKVGSLLSGGLDSSSITVLADCLQNGNFESFSIVAKDRKYSEEFFIDILVAEKRIKNSKQCFEPEAALKSLDDVIFHNDEPFGSLSVVAQYSILKKLKEESDISVVMSGQGGDEALMGYLKYFFFHVKECFKRGNLIEAVREIFLSFLNRTVIWQFNFKEAKRYIPFFYSSTKPFLNMRGNIERIDHYNSLRERQILDIDRFSVPALAHYEDRTSMAHSLEVRHPFLDHRLVNMLVNLPAEFKIKHGWTKYILRRTVTELPDRIRWRRDKMGFDTAEELWIKKDLRGLIERVFCNSVLEEMGFIDGKAFLRYYVRFLNGKGSILYSDISRCLLAELWAKKFLANQEADNDETIFNSNRSKTI